MKPMLTPEKTGMLLWDLVAKECDCEAIEAVNQKIHDTWKQIARKYGEDVAQETLCQAFEKAARGKVEKPLHYAAAAAWNVDKDECERERSFQKFRVALSHVRWEKRVPPEENEADEPPFGKFQKTPPEARIYRDPVSEVEAMRLARVIDYDPAGRRLINQTDGEGVKISPSQVSKARVRVLKRVLAE